MYTNHATLLTGYFFMDIERHEISELPKTYLATRRGAIGFFAKLEPENEACGWEAISTEDYEKAFVLSEK